MIFTPPFFLRFRSNIHFRLLNLHVKSKIPFSWCKDDDKNHHDTEKHFYSAISRYIYIQVSISNLPCSAYIIIYTHTHTNNHIYDNAQQYTNIINTNTLEKSYTQF